MRFCNSPLKGSYSGVFRQENYVDEKQSDYPKEISHGNQEASKQR